MEKYILLDKYGWPVEGIIGRPIVSFTRYLIHGRKIIKLSTWRTIERLREISGNIRFETGGK